MNGRIVINRMGYGTEMVVFSFLCFVLMVV